MVKSAVMEKKYVEKRGGGYYVAGTRVSLDSIVYMFRERASPEYIHHSFSVLTLEEVYGAIAFYLRNEKRIDKYLEDLEIKFEREASKRQEKFKKMNPDLYERLREARKALSR